MRIIRLMMLGVLIVVTALCFEAAWQGAQDLDEVLGRARWAHTDFIIRAHRVRAPELKPSPVEVAEPEWHEVEPPGPNHFAPDALARLPEFSLESRAGFGAYLQHHSDRAPTKFEIEP